MISLRRAELWLGLAIVAMVILIIVVSNLDDAGKIALLGLLGFLGLGFGLIPFDQWRENARERRDASRRNHAHRS